MDVDVEDDDVVVVVEKRDECDVCTNPSDPVARRDSMATIDDLYIIVSICVCMESVCCYCVAIVDVGWMDKER